VYYSHGSRGLGKRFSPARDNARANDFIALWPAGPPASSLVCEQANEEGIIDPRATTAWSTDGARDKSS